MSRTRSTASRRGVIALSLAVATGLTVQATAFPAEAATAKAPTGLSVDNPASSTPILSWNKVPKATKYVVQIDDDAGFGSPEFDVTTVNIHAVPTKPLKAGGNHWRVRAIVGSDASSWAPGQLDTSAVSQPVPVSPADNATLPQPAQPPLLRWEGTQGASSYVVEVDGDSDFVGAKSYTTKSTSLIIPDPLNDGDYFWRVTASKGSGLVSLPSAAYRFVIAPLAQPVTTFPADSVDTAEIEDVVLDWAPVVGAKAYDLQVALDASFNNIAHSVTNIQSTRYSPPTTLNSDQFWWRVRAVDLAGQATPWTESIYGFKRVWPQIPQAVFPLGTQASPTVVTTSKPRYQWTPVPHATTYELQISTNVNFSPGVTKTCETASTTYTPTGYNSACNFPGDNTTVQYWRVRPIDLPYPGGLPGIYSTPQAFTYSAPAGPAGAWDPQAQVTGLKVSVDGEGAVDPAKGCAAASLATICDGLPTTPVLSWDPVPGANYYYVYYAQDANFTTTVIPGLPVTTNTIFQLRKGDSLMALPDSQAGSAYFWHVRPCANAGDCGPDPESVATTLPDTRAFRKASPAVTGLNTSSPAGTEITFNWQDYHPTNRATVAYGEQSNQSAMNYRIQVDTEPSFTTPLLDNRVVDQATYTAFDRIYPEGTLYWRVQAIDAQNQGLTWSATQTLTKSSPPIALTSPVSNAQVSGTTPLTWQPQAFAASYTVEVYKNADTTFSSANRLFTATVKNPAYAWTDLIPASGTPYVWRVRRTDSAGNVGPWSETGSFVSLGAAPTLLAPANKLQPGAELLFRWTEVPGASSYKLDLQVGGSNAGGVTTAAIAWAPTTALKTGTYTWTVTATDSGGNVLGTSAPGAFKVDSTPPTVKKITPKELAPKSKVKVLFSERVKGVSKKTLKLALQVTKKNNKVKYVPVKAKVKVLKKGKGAQLTPKKRLKTGTYALLLNSEKIKDLAGNNLTATKPTIQQRASVGS